MKRIALLTTAALLLTGLTLTGVPLARAQDQGVAHEQHHPTDQVPPQPVARADSSGAAASGTSAGAGGSMMGMMSPETMRQMMGGQDGGGMMMRPMPGITIIINTQAMPPMHGAVMGGPGDQRMVGEQMGQQSMAGAASPSTTAYRQVITQMQRGMDTQLSGDPDGDFARLMIPHHQSAIEIARIALQQGKDPEIQQLAQAVIDAQEREITTLRTWLAKNPQR